ncbi:hypothetical protein D1115_07835 [Vibrio alfacsensis]|uniref:Site-specific integrase n=1 Tax=Vibrio alfacsensis TaxID=1074311 RepID=A0ABM6YWZ4_9VIBR|nr:hypothetical protein [Vibrio alfacsensis]AXY02346.1 hypothetical protein D1115_07835 [Vibrio alfacsensis]
MTDADIELQHIWLEVQTERWQNLSRFLFSYYCYQHNLVTKSNKVCWETARANLPVSASIQTRKNAIIEPLIPENAVIGLLKTIHKDGDMTWEAMQKTLNDFLHYVVISKSEKVLLKPNMPANWYQHDHKPVMARFEQAGITIQGN